VAFNSGLAAHQPVGMGLLLLGVAPLVPILSTGPACERAVGGLVLGGLGLYNALELARPRYSSSERFWRNMAAWHLGAGVIALSSWATGADQPPAPPSPPLAIGVGLTPGGAGLQLAGRF
jgi:hypothetical protein